ncbi:MAG: hypothetical protein C4306_04570, partial [Thermoleophilia bacterium]
MSVGHPQRSSVLAYHEQTKHTPASVRRLGPGLDWANRPHPFKEYRELPPRPLPVRLETLLRLGAGVRRERRYPGGLVYHFRTYASAGALYPVEVYVADEEGLFHFHPRELALRQLRAEDVRGALAEAASDSGLAEAETVLVLTGILWRTAWKYRARGYRHLYWDAGTMLANLLAVAAAEGREARLGAAFVDAAVNRLVGVDGRREAALALLRVSRSQPAPKTGALGEIDLPVEPLSAREVEYPQAYAAHEASSLRSPEKVRAFRAFSAGSVPPPVLSLPELERVLARRGSTREFSSTPIAGEDLRFLLAFASAGIPADFPPLTEVFVVVHAVDGLAPGAYRFTDGEFVLLREGSDRRLAGRLCLEQSLGARAAALVFFLADLERVVALLGERG